MAENTTDDNKDLNQSPTTDQDVRQAADSEKLEKRRDELEAEPKGNPEVIVSSMHSRKRTFITVALLLCFVALAAVILIAIDNKQQPKSATVQAPTQVQVAAVVTISSSGFSPATVEIKKGQSVTWKNADTANHQPSSDPYPTNTGLADLGRSEVLKQNDEFTYQFEKAGTYTYHDNLNPYKLKGTVIVSE